MNNATSITNPANSRQTVGNSPKSVRVAERVQNFGKDTNFSLRSTWAALQNQTSSSVANTSKPLTNPQISLYGSYDGTLIPNTESGEGVVQSGTAVAVTDYYPYGTKRIDTNPNATDRQFIGERYDASTDLNYLNARYLNSNRGQFLSQDPTFLALGNPNQLQQLSKQSQQQFLGDPQQGNSYSYARGNPIVNRDPNGRQYTNVSGSFVFPVVYVGPTGGFYLTPGNDSDPYISFGITISKPGGSGSATYSPTGSPSEGWSMSLSAFPPSARGLGGQVNYGQDSTGNSSLSGEGGIGTPGYALSLTYTTQASKWLDYLGGPLENVTTPALANPSHFYTQRNVSNASIWQNSSAQFAATNYLQGQNLNQSSNGMARNVIVGHMSNGAALYCSGVCGK